MSVRLRLALALAATLLGVTAARAGTIEGRVSHASKPEAVAGLVVQVIGIDASEQTIQRETRADADGRYRFVDLPVPAAYLVRARYGELVFPGGSAVFRPGEPELSHTVDFSVYDSSSDASRLRIASLQWVIARSAGVWRINQNAVVANPDPAVVLATPDAPAMLRIALAPGHGEVESLFGRLPEGVVIRDGVAEIRGPILPGADGFSLQLAYDLTTPDAELDTTLALPDAVDELGVYVQDFGIIVHAGPLHPARPTRENDVIYQSFLGFELPAGSVVPLRVVALAPLAVLPQAALGLVAAGLAGALLYFVAGPLVLAGRRAAGGLAVEAPEESPAKAALAAALHDLEHDFETGKLSPDDRDRLREDLRREALGALARERGQLEARPAPRSAEPAPRVCVCGREAQAHDRFCASCGKAL
ncbi:MAG: carboxypeptidase-like regulatory domain-containing protein [Myxococcota bacterium]